MPANARIEAAATEKVKTSSGLIPVSTPAMTAFDLVRYRRGAGSIDHVATVLSELAERLDGAHLVALAKKREELSVVQRLGYLLDLTGHEALTGQLAEFVEAADPKFVPSGAARSGPPGATSAGA